MTRSDNRSEDSLRPVTLELDFVSQAEGSVLVRAGKTRVLCNASLDKDVPRWLKGQGKGWVTAEYALMPRSTNTRVDRERKGASGRTQEIQRLVGRSLRACTDLVALGERQIIVDCDVIEADGGTRTASITGGFVALALAISRLKAKEKIDKQILTGWLSAISVGVVDGIPLLDLCYEEDSRAGTDMNVVAGSAPSAASRRTRWAACCRSSHSRGCRPYGRVPIPPYPTLAHPGAADPAPRFQSATTLLRTPRGCRPYAAVPIRDYPAILGSRLISREIGGIRSSSQRARPKGPTGPVRPVVEADMSDPIALIQDILSGFATPPTNTASTGSTTTGSGTSAASNATPDYTLSASLSSILSQGTSTGLTGNALATYNVQALMAQSQSSLLSALPSDTSGETAFFNQLSLYQQYLATANASTAGATSVASTASAAADPLASILSVANTNADAASASSPTDMVQSLLSSLNTASPDPGLSGTDAILAQVVADSQSILNQ